MRGQVDDRPLTLIDRRGLAEIGAACRIAHVAERNALAAINGGEHTVFENGQDMISPPSTLIVWPVM